MEVSNEVAQFLFEMAIKYGQKSIRAPVCSASGKQIMDEIATLDAKSAEVLANIRRIL